MSNKDPAFLFYSSDFLVGVSDLTMEERGQYITLIALQHQKGHLSKRNIDLSVPNVSEFVLAKFQIDENGCYYNERTEEEIKKREKYITAQRTNGAKGGRPKNPNKTRGLEKENPRAKPSENENRIINSNILNFTKCNNNDIDSIYNKTFEEFWEKYPRKVAKKYAFDCYMRLEMTEELHQMMLSALEKQRRSKAWENSKYIPHPSTWLNQHRWEDEIPEEELSSFDTDDFFNTALERSRKIFEKGAKEYEQRKRNDV